MKLANISLKASLEHPDLYPEPPSSTLIVFSFYIVVDHLQSGFKGGKFDRASSTLVVESVCKRPMYMEASFR